MRPISGGHFSSVSDGGGSGAQLGDANTWTADQTFSTADAGTTTVTRPAVVLHTTSGTAAAGFGSGVSLVAEDASGNNDEAGRLDAAWLVATDGATQASRTSLWVREANAMVEVGRLFGQVGFQASAMLDLDAVLSIGRGSLDSRVADNFFLSHRDQLGSTGGHARFTSAGQVIINGVSTSSVDIRNNGTTRISVNSTGLGFFAATPVAQQTVGAVSYTVVDYATDGPTIRTHLGEIATALRNLGLGA